ncbi:uracil-DNA glycosylase family protein, partial [Achromobacter dolens]|uniref:uracil-DNA glycosylase n=2 Tax=Alcaligenaceae TaxID=506 RepID=UPI003F5BDF05
PPPPAVAQAQAPAARPAGPGPGLRNGPPPKPVPKAAVEEAAPVVIPVAEAVKNANLDELREQVLACTACGLCGGRRHAVFGHGGQPTRWLVVGEAPGEQEDRQGQPFVGRSGQLLDAMLSAVGMSRERDVFIANVIKCRPPGNRNPKPEEIAACSPYLMRQIALLKPERILVLGRFAAQTLLGTDATIGSLRGRVHQMKTDEGREIPVVVSYHPAYLLRSPAEKARAWQDLKLAARQS